ncbi:TadE/TadG family type IV pilus assembly protein [Nitratireductor basaltis]|uniref:VWFA domain-containing protein n=1 Tax=Nitratireductor basaltis TaxID=472175 RepID=A0A084U9D0_9HYPH|nr:TadE/TadG family type IV pilus assembly protein [Nitratireductor basaltis]KFB09566.1 hypothetical protein EL18_00582 [Nitratireductor basaltis]
MKTLSRYSLTRVMRSFLSDRAGNFAMMTAIAAVPLVGAAGLAVDYATMSRTRAELQQALDAAVLAVAQKGEDISDAQAREIARAYMTGNLKNVYRDLEIVREGTSVSMRANVDTDLSFGGIFGIDKQKVGAAATADLAYASYEVALVLDTTGSMRGGKLQSMKDAVTGMIDDMSSQVRDPEKLKFSLVPFATFVNVGPEHAPEFDDKGKMKKKTGAPWLDLKGKADFPQLELLPKVSRFELYHHLGQEWKGCVETRFPTRKGAHDVDDTEPGKDKNSYFTPTFAIDEPDDTLGKGRWATDYYENNYIDANRLIDALNPLDASDKTKKLKLEEKYEARHLLLGLGLGFGDDDDDDDRGIPGGGRLEIDDTGGKGPNFRCTVKPLTPLTSNYADLKLKVRQFEADGTTNILEGVAWGQRVLSPHEPFTEGSDPQGADGKVEKIMVVLTDGANNFGNNSRPFGSSYSSFGYLVEGRLGVVGGSGVTRKMMDDKTLEACTNAKEDGTIIYTIRLEEPDRATGDMLQRCASSPAHFFDAPSRSQLKNVFERIGEDIVKLRLSS